MSGREMTNEEKKQLSRERQMAVRHAWKNEKALAEQGKGTRNWSEGEQKELIDTGRVSGYEGHHMKSVSLYPEYAGDSKNIQFLNENEHFNGAHQGNYHNLTNGYYDPVTNQMNEFDGDELIEVPVINLEEYSYSNNGEIEDLKNDFYQEQESNMVESDINNAKDEFISSCDDNSFDESDAMSEADAPGESNGMGLR